MPKAHAKAVRGPIPVNITYVLRAPSTVKRGWDQGDDDPDLPVVDTFPVDADSPGSLATARAWASHYYGRSNGAPAEPVEFTVPNAPMTGVTLVSLEHRGQGGRAWKVTVEPHPDHPPLRVDFREGPLLETLLTTGCAAGEIAGEFIWGRVGTSLQLIRVGSPLHRSLAAQHAVQVRPVLSARDYVAGHAYLTRSGDRLLFLGKLDGTDVRYDHDARDPATRRRYDSPPLVIAEHAAARTWLLLEYRYGRQPPPKTTPAEALAELLADGSVRLTRNERPTVVTDIGPVPLPAGCADWPTAVRAISLAALARAEARDAEYARQGMHRRYTDGERALNALRGCAEEVYLRAPGTPAPDVPELRAGWVALGRTPPGLAP